MAATDALGPQFDPQRGREFASLTYQGQLFYADQRSKDGASHEQAFRDARYSYGTKRKIGGAR